MLGVHAQVPLRVRQGLGFSVGVLENPDWEDTPEEKVLLRTCDALRTWHSEISFIDNLIEAMQKKRFKGRIERWTRYQHSQRASCCSYQPAPMRMWARNMTQTWWRQVAFTNEALGTCMKYLLGYTTNKEGTHEEL